jgi:hypothetical protein
MNCVAAWPLPMHWQCEKTNIGRTLILKCNLVLMLVSLLFQQSASIHILRRQHYAYPSLPKCTGKVKHEQPVWLHGTQSWCRVRSPFNWMVHAAHWMGETMDNRSVRLGGAQSSIVLLTVATALIHIYLAFQFPAGPDPIFLLNGLGYLGLVTLLYAPLLPLVGYRALIRWVLMAYAALTIILWSLMGARTPLAYIDKLIEVALVSLLWLEQQAVARE